MQTVKLCKTCGLTLSMDEFYNTRNECKTCKKVRADLWRLEHPEWYKANRRKIYYRKKDGYLEYQKKWRKENPEKFKEQQHRHDEARKSNPRRRIQLKMYSAVRRSYGKPKLEIIQMVYEDNIKKYGTLTCIYCLKKILFGEDSLEHLTPLSREGTHDYSNLAVTCITCNKQKHAKTDLEYRKHKELSH